MAENFSTPEKKFTYIDYTPSTKQLVCVLCGDRVTKREYRRKLFHGNSKTEFCFLIEKHLDICICQDLHTDILCRKCLRDVQKIETTVNSLKESYKKTITSLKQSHGKETTKRQIAGQNRDEESSSKRKELFPDRQSENEATESASEDVIQVEVRYGRRISHHIIHQEFSALLNSLFSNDIQKIASVCFQNDHLKNFFQSHLINIIKDEIRNLCSKETNSVLRQTNQKELSVLSWNRILDEWTDKAPTFKNLLQSIVSNPSHQRNKVKKGDALVSGFVSAGCKLLSVYSQDLNALQHMHSIILLKGGCKKSTFTTLCSTYDTLSYQATLSIADKFGEDWSSEIQSWAEDIEQDRNKENSLIQEIQDITTSINFIDGNAEEAVDLIFQLSALQDDLENHRKSMHPGYYFVGDNVDMRTKVRHMTTENQNKDQHLFQLCAYQNRISGNHLDNSRPKADIDTFPLASLLPSEKDSEDILEEFAHIVAWTWATLIPAFTIFQTVLPRWITHHHMIDTMKKSIRVNMGVLDKNEQYNDQMTDICEFLHTFVPGHDESEDWKQQPEQTLSGGDYLTFERHKQAQASKRNGRTPSKRLEGLIPKMEEFHNQAEFLQVIWKALYSCASARDQGTLYAARNTINARNVTQDPSDDFYASADLVEKVTKAYIVTGALAYFGMDFLQAEPTTNQYAGPLGDANDMKLYIMMHARTFVHMYALPELVKIPNFGQQQLTLKCRYCEKLYKKPTALRKHEANVHHHNDPLFNLDKEKQETTTSITKSEDCVFNYTKQILTMGLLHLNQKDAISMGDGVRIMRINQFLCMYYKATNCTKYAFGMLETISQSRILLSERMAHRLIWNRTVNHKGDPDSNFPNDLDVEHCNKVFKENARSYRGVFTEKTVLRVSRSAQAIDKIAKQYDRMNKVFRPSGRHKEANFEKDILVLVQQYSGLNLFSYTPGRFHSAFPQLHDSLLRTLDIEKVREWIASSLKKFKQKHFYRN